MARNVHSPKGVLPVAELHKLLPRSRDAYASNLLLEVLDRNAQGVTVSKLVQTTQLSRNTVLKHLERLVGQRRATKKDFGYVAIYYKGGSIDEDKGISKDFGDTSYEFQLLDRGQEGKYVYVQERQLDEFGSPRINGGILVRSDRVLEFIKSLSALGIGK